MKSLSSGTATLAVVSSLASTAHASVAALFAGSTVTEGAQANAFESELGPVGRHITGGVVDENESNAFGANFAMAL